VTNSSACDAIRDDMKRLVDTSAWIEALRPEGDPDTRRAVDEATRGGDALLCDMVLVELWIGARGKREQDVIAGLEADLQVLPIGTEVWRAARVLARACRAAGVTVPAADLVIAACADHYRVGLIERDQHYAQIAAARARRKR
jgi:predicted nucleic acid-binding protein